MEDWKQDYHHPLLRGLYLMLLIANSICTERGKHQKYEMQISQPKDHGPRLK